VTEIRSKATTPEYAAGYDLAGMGTGPRRPGRTRYVYDGAAKAFVEIGSDWTPTDRRTPVVGDSHYDGLRATDGTDVSSRTKHRNYMKANGLALASDYTETWAQAERERTAPSRDPERREQLGRALYEQQNRSRRG
jgi:hypothetical protein